MKEILGVLTASTLIVGVIAFVTKSIINKLIDTGADIFKNKMEKELEVHKKNLDLIKIQYQIQYSSLNEKRSDFIAQLFNLLYDLEISLQKYTSVINSDWPKVGMNDFHVNTRFDETKSLFEKNRIYLESSLCDSIELNLNEIEKMIRDMSVAKAKASALGNGAPITNFKEGESPVEIWSKLDTKARGDIINNRKLLTVQFRKLIGVSEI
jgi:hypothetical protein